jgi:hypothetical protein
MYFIINLLLYLSAQLPFSGSYINVVTTYSDKIFMQESYITNVQVLIYLFCMIIALGNAISYKTYNAFVIPI